MGVFCYTGIFSHQRVIQYLISMTTILITILFLFGLIIGSFLNVLILRHGNEGHGATDGRSECMTCHKQLHWYELIPVVSWLIQRGRCRRCPAKIFWQYPLVELATGGLFVFGYYLYFPQLGISLLDQITPLLLLGFITLLVALSISVAIFVYDLYHQLIPDAWSLTFALSSLVYTIVQFILSGNLWGSEFWWVVAAGPILFLPFYLLWKVSDGKWIGLGDGKLAVGIGWLLGLSLGISAVIYSFWLGALFAIGMIATQKILAKKDISLKTAVAFGPFMIIATLFTLLTQITTLELVDYLSLILI